MNKKIKINVVGIVKAMSKAIKNKKQKNFYRDIMLDNIDDIKKLVDEERVESVIDFYLRGRLSMIDIADGIVKPVERQQLVDPMDFCDKVGQTVTVNGRTIFVKSFEFNMNSGPKVGSERIHDPLSLRDDEKTEPYFKDKNHIA